MDYMDQPHEVAKHPGAKQAFAVMANGNKDAFSFLWVLWNWMHVYDDLNDRDTAVIQDEIVTKHFAQFVVQLTHNQFFIANKDSLTTLMLSLFNRYLDGNAWEQSKNDEQKSVSQLLKCGDIDFYLHVAYLTGGWDHMRKCSKEFRCYDDNLQKKEQ